MAANDRKRPLGPSFSVPPPPPHKEEGGVAGPLIGNDQKRNDGRLLKQLRPMYLRTDVVSGASGSCYLEQGANKVVCAVYGPHEGRLAQYSGVGQLDCEFKWAPFAQGDVRSTMQDNSEKYYSQQLDNALVLSVQLDNYPKAVIDVHVTVIEDGGNAFASSLICASTALTHAGILLYDLVAASTVALVEDQLVSDPSPQEQAKQRGEVVVGLMPALNEISAIMVTGLVPREIVVKAVEQAMDGCAQVHTVMQEVLRQPSETAQSST